MRVTTAFKRVLRLPGASVIDVAFGAEEVVVTVRLRRRRRVCAVCGQTGAQLEIHDRRVKRWRHLDLGANRCVIECQLRRLRCPDCRTVRLEPVTWARPDSPLADLPAQTAQLHERADTATKTAQDLRAALTRLANATPRQRRRVTADLRASGLLP